MIGEDEVALWHQALDSTDALDVYVDWLLTHDPVRGECVRRRMRKQPTSDERGEEHRAWVKALGLDGRFVCSHVDCNPLPTSVKIDVSRIEAVGPVVDRLPFLRIDLDFSAGGHDKVFASPVMAKIRVLSYDACASAHADDNSQSTQLVYYGAEIVEALCRSPNVTQLDTLWLGDEPGADCAQRIAAVPFTALRELSFYEAPIGDEGLVALAGSSIGKTLRNLYLYRSGIGNAGARALARMKLERLTINHHDIGVIGAAALRAMPTLKQLELVPPVANPFESPAAFRAHCGEPAMPIDECPLCSATEDYCDSSWVSSMVSDYDIDYGDEGAARKWNNIPAAFTQLQPCIEADRTSSSSGYREKAVMRCPTCRRLYLYVDTSDYAGATTYSKTSYRRLEADAMFDAYRNVK